VEDVNTILKKIDLIGDNKNIEGLKSLSNCWGKIVDKSLITGNQHFGITINLPQSSLNYLNKKEVFMEYMYCEKTSNNLDFSGYWDVFNGDERDGFGNYYSLQYTNCFSRDNIISSICNCLCENFTTTSFLFSVIENKNNKYHFHIIIGIKNFID
jgi:hypothetical protein